MRKKRLIFLLVIMVVITLLAACASTPANQEGNNNAQIANEGNNQDEGQDTPEEMDIPAQESCTGLGSLLEEHLKLESELISKTFSSLENGISGEGCQLTVGGNVTEVGDWATNNSKFVESMFDSGWVMDSNFSAALDNGQLLTVRKGEHVCMFYSVVRPLNANLCLEGESLADCLTRLEPSDIIYEATVSCTPDTYVAQEEVPETASDEGDNRITFAEEETSTYVSGKLEPASIDTYVVQAEEGQELVVSLINSPPHQGLLVIYGEDGTVLISDHAETAFWSGIIPITQDYFIDVRSSPEYALSYNMEIVLPPQGEMHTALFQPMEFSACEDLSEIISSATGVEAQIGDALFYDYIAQGAGRGCQISVWGTWDLFGDRNIISSKLMTALAADGWEEAPAYAAGGAGGFGTGFIKDENVCLYFELVHEVDPWVCEDYEGAISECWSGLADTEMYYEIQLTCATAQ